MLQQRGYYTITLSDETKINLLFNVETIFDFSDRRKYSFQQLFILFGTGGMTAKDFGYLFYCAAESYCREKKEECPYKIEDAYGWLEDIGVASDEWKAISDILKEIVENLASGKKNKLKAVV